LRPERTSPLAILANHLYWVWQGSVSSVIGGLHRIEHFLSPGFRVGFEVKPPGQDRHCLLRQAPSLAFGLLGESPVYVLWNVAHLECGHIQ
jgi:hypothetical protein